MLHMVAEITEVCEDFYTVYVTENVTPFFM